MIFHEIFSWSSEAVVLRGEDREDVVLCYSSGGTRVVIRHDRDEGSAVRGTVGSVRDVEYKFFRYGISNVESKGGIAG